MNLSFILMVSALLLIFSKIIKIKLSKPSTKKNIDKENPFIDLNEKYITNGHNKKSIDTIRIYNPIDGDIIRSILDSADIETFISYNHMNNLYPGIQIPGHTTSIISIYEEKIGQAIPLINDYINNLKSHEKTKVSSKIRNITEFALFGQTMPKGRDKRIPELII